jgi:hypothetical protein
MGQWVESLAGENEVPLCPPEIPQYPTRARTLTAAVATFTLVIIVNTSVFIMSVIYVSFCIRWVYIRSRVVCCDVNNNVPLFDIKISGSG